MGSEWKGYKAFDTGDGFFVVPNVPIFSAIKKGERDDAPIDADEAFLKKVVAFSVKEHAAGSYVAPVHLGHNKFLAVTDPAFLGYVLPTHVADFQFADKMLPTIFSKVRLTKAAFEKAQREELPYNSVEINFETAQIHSLSFLQSQAPHYHYPVFKISEVQMDPTAKFEAIIKRFEHKGEAAECCGHCETHEKAIAEMKAKGVNMAEVPPTQINPPQQRPIEQQGGKPTGFEQASPELLAKFAAQSAQLEEMQKKFDKQERERQEKERIDKAMVDLAGKKMTEDAKQVLCSLAGDPAKFEALVKAYKSLLMDKSSGTLEDAERRLADQAGSHDTIVAKFSDKYKERAPKALEFANNFRQLQKTKQFGSTMIIGSRQMTAEDFVDIQFQLMDAKKESTAFEGGN